MSRPERCSSTETPASIASSRAPISSRDISREQNRVGTPARAFASAIPRQKAVLPIDGRAPTTTSWLCSIPRSRSSRSTCPVDKPERPPPRSSAASARARARSTTASTDPGPLSSIVSPAARTSRDSASLRTEPASRVGSSAASVISWPAPASRRLRANPATIEAYFRGELATGTPATRLTRFETPIPSERPSDTSAACTVIASTASPWSSRWPTAKKTLACAGL